MGIYADRQGKVTIRICHWPVANEFQGKDARWIAFLLEGFGRFDALPLPVEIVQSLGLCWERGQMICIFYPKDLFALCTFWRVVFPTNLGEKENLGGNWYEKQLHQAYLWV